MATSPKKVKVSPRRRTARSVLLTAEPTLRDVLRCQATIYNDMRKKTMSAKEGARLVYVLREVRETARAVETDARVAELQARLDVLEGRR